VSFSSERLSDRDVFELSLGGPLHNGDHSLPDLVSPWTQRLGPRLFSARRQRREPQAVLRSLAATRIGDAVHGSAAHEGGAKGSLRNRLNPVLVEH
jgi:hypothetical protein